MSALAPGALAPRRRLDRLAGRCPSSAERAWEAVLAEGYRERGYDLVPVLLSEEEVKGFYEGFSNAILWPLFHDLLGQCDFDPAFWYTYLKVNEKFADAVLRNSREGDFVWVQDYQLIHVAELMRRRHGGVRDRLLPPHPLPAARHPAEAPLARARS